MYIPIKLANHLKSLGFEAIHINNILEGSRTKDNAISKFADEQDFIVITKDSDFRDSYFIKQTPKKLIKINLGNISNNELKDIIINHLNILRRLYSQSHFLLEINKDDPHLLIKE